MVTRRRLSDHGHHFFSNKVSFHEDVYIVLHNAVTTRLTDYSVVEMYRLHAYMHWEIETCVTATSASLQWSGTGPTVPEAYLYYLSLFSQRVQLPFK